MKRDPHGPPDLSGEYPRVAHDRRGWEVAWALGAVVVLGVFAWAVVRFLQFWSTGGSR